MMLSNSGVHRRMLTKADIAAWLEIQLGLAKEAERAWQAKVLQDWYDRRRREIYEQMGGRDALA